MFRFPRLGDAAQILVVLALRPILQAQILPFITAIYPLQRFKFRAIYPGDVSLS